MCVKFCHKKLDRCSERVVGGGGGGGGGRTEVSTERVFLKITAQQAQLDLRLSRGSVHGSSCSNKQLVWPKLFSLSPVADLLVILCTCI
jgi:hypothetical protein